MINLNIQLDFLQDKSLFDRRVVPYWEYKHGENDMKKYKKEYKYFNAETNKIEKFTVYDFLKHIRSGLIFETNKKEWIDTPYQSINIKLTEKNKISIKCNLSDDQSFLYFMYDWVNKLLVYDSDMSSWHTSLTGWVEREMHNMLRVAFGQYFLEKPNALIITHKDNYSKLNDNYKHLAIFLVDSSGYLKVNYTGRQTIYVGNNELHTNFSGNFLGKCCRPNSWINKYRARNLIKQIGRIPYIKLYKYDLISTLNRSDYWFDTFAFTITENYDLPKKIVTNKNNFIQTTDYFLKTEHIKDLTNGNLNTIKKFNNFDKEVEDTKLDDASNEAEKANFLYDNQNLVRVTFTSEINKHVYLISGISFFDKIRSDGKILLIKAESKLKFDFKKKREISYFDFNISPTIANKKIKFKKRQINNLMIVSTDKLTRIGQKRKMPDIVETLLIKALQNYDKYTILNPLEVNLH